MGFSIFIPFSPILPGCVTVELIRSFFYSSYAKQKLVGLHPNVMVQRSPSHFQTGTFYWAHVRQHSCGTPLMRIVQLILFPWIVFVPSAWEDVCNRSDNCFHGWSGFVFWPASYPTRMVGYTSLIVVVGSDGIHHNTFWRTIPLVQIGQKYGLVRKFHVTPCVMLSITTLFLQGKDYSNPRITDFFNLHKPEEDMYDRTKVPRMPWYAFLCPQQICLLSYRWYPPI